MKTRVALSIAAVASSCGAEPVSDGSSSQASPPFFGVVPQATNSTPGSFIWLEDPPIVAGAPVSRVGLLASSYSLRGLGVDKLGGITTLGSTPFDGTKAELFLERFTNAGVQVWVRRGVCNRALGALNLHVNDSGQSLFSADFSDGCNWEGSSIESSLNPAPVAQPFVVDEQAQAAGPSEDVFLVAHSDHGTQRGFAQMSGAGRQGVRALFPLPPAPQWFQEVNDESSASTETAPRGDLQVGVLLNFAASAQLGERRFDSSSGGVAADSLCIRAQAAPLGSSSEKVTDLALEFGEGLHLKGASIERVAARQHDLLLAGTGALPALLSERMPAEADEATAPSVPRGWLASLSAEGEVTELVHWRPAIAPSSLALAPDGSVYAAFDHNGLQFEDPGAVPADDAADAGSANADTNTAPAYHLVRFDADGVVQWQKTFLTQAVHSVHLAATNAAVALWGSHLGSVDVDGIIAPSAVGDTANALVMALTEEGSILSVQHWGNATGVDAASLPVPHPAGGFIGVLSLSAGDDVRSVMPGSYLLWVPN